MRRTDREFFGDVIYDVWRAGGNPDAVDRDRVSDAYRDHDEVEHAVARELRAQRHEIPDHADEDDADGR